MIHKRLSWNQTNITPFFLCKNKFLSPSYWKRCLFHLFQRNCKKTLDFGGLNPYILLKKITNLSSAGMSSATVKSLTCFKIVRLYYIFYCWFLINGNTIIEFGCTLALGQASYLTARSCSTQCVSLTQWFVVF